MKRILYFCIIIFCLESCAPTVNYIGKSYNPTTYVDIFMDKMDVTRDYEVMGYADVKVQEGIQSLQSAQGALEKYAREKGADAIIIENVDTMITPDSSTTKKESTSDGNGNKSSTYTTTHENTTINIIKASLIKYK